jgi:hypothetical protein
LPLVQIARTTDEHRQASLEASQEGRRWQYFDAGGGKFNG